MPRDLVIVMQRENPKAQINQRALGLPVKGIPNQDMVNCPKRSRRTYQIFEMFLRILLQVAADKLPVYLARAGKLWISRI